MRFEVVGEAVVEGSNSRCLYLAEGRDPTCDVFVPWCQRYIQPESIVLLHLAALFRQEGSRVVVVLKMIIIHRSYQLGRYSSPV